MRRMLLGLVVVGVLLWSPLLLAQTLLSEGFEGATFPPTGWAKYETGDTDDPGWQQTDGSTPFNVSAHGGTYSAAHNDDNLDTPAISWLVTPQLSIDSSVYLHFWEAYYYSFYYQYHGVWVSSGSCDPNDGDFSELQEIPHTGNSNEWHLYHISLASYNGQNICIAFRYEGDYEDEWYVDDVLVDHNPVPVELMSYAVE